ncbi:hypothetical protein IE81DRAFT_285613 [Ceraceosorus guamensis]|uniref:Yeast cell wall synthesis Kre9/Knh1-like N-terminal domain-containing protein n=1 Tax=Ceraceosorus guamensis TaxID=1522189 RepID=A0A316W635_9BASI|nr:hypothetical protein IE81DRAFT_285613 [Ceraceosorus guamensis]PWN45386.1 hypothetical protein IE81DRAFT_285613 [Ceraceosorus guamensis]
MCVVAAAQLGQAAPVSSAGVDGDVAATPAAPEASSSDLAQVVAASASLTSAAAAAAPTAAPLAGPSLVPLSPGPADVFKSGGTCSTTWSPAFAWTNGQAPWANFTIDLMTGSNDNMTKLATVASNLDGTDYSKTKYDFQCPDAQPYSKIYFLQFSNPSGSNATTWTTRFTLASANGETTAPEHETQPDGEDIAWGQGKLISVGSTSGNITPAEGSRAAALVSGKQPKSLQQQTASQSSSSANGRLDALSGVAGAIAAACAAMVLI